MNATPNGSRSRPPARYKGGDDGGTLAEHVVRRRLCAIQHGSLVLCDGPRMDRYGTASAHCPLSETMRVHDPRFYSEVAFGGSVGAGEAYIQG